MEQFNRHFRIYFNNHTAYIIDATYSDIKKAGRTQIHLYDDRATIATSAIIKPKRKKKGKKNGRL